MNDKDAAKGDSVATPEGLGHDPLEWLQDDDEDTALSVTSDEPQVPAADATDVANTKPDDVSAVVTHEPESLPEPEPEPEPEPIASAASEAQSFTFDNHKAILTLPEKLTVQIIEPLHSEWKTLLYDLPQSLEIDASQVKDIDAAGMQLFYAMVQQMVFKGSDVVILNVQPSLTRHFELFGLHDFFTQYIHAA